MPNKITDDKLIGSRIRDMRLLKGYSLEELSKKIGYKDKTALSKIEIGKQGIPRKRLILLTQIFEVDLSYFLDGTELGTTLLPEIDRYEASKKKINSNFKTKSNGKSINNDSLSKTHPDQYAKYERQMTSIIKTGQFEMHYTNTKDSSGHFSLKISSPISDESIIVPYDYFDEIFMSPKILKIFGNQKLKVRIVDSDK